MKKFLKFLLSLIIIISTIDLSLNQNTRSTTTYNTGNLPSATRNPLTRNNSGTGPITMISGTTSRISGSGRTGTTTSSSSGWGSTSTSRTPGTLSSTSGSISRNPGYTSTMSNGSTVSRNNGSTRTTTNSWDTTGVSRNGSTNISGAASSTRRSTTGATSFRDRGLFANTDTSTSSSDNGITESSGSIQPETSSINTSNRSPSASSSPISSLNISRNNQYGSYLTNGDGMTLYVNVKDGPGVVTCYEECAKRFIPTYIKVGESININTNLDEKLVATIGRSDGISQLTYNDYPLYVYVGDKDPNQITGQGYEEIWYLISDKGKPIKGNGPNEEEISSTTSSLIENNSGSAGPDGKTLKITGTTSILVVPDTFIFYFNIFTRNPDFSVGLQEAEKKSKDLVAVIRKLNTDFNSDMTKVSLVDKKMFFQNNTSIFSHTYITTTTKPEIIDKVTIAVRRLNKIEYNIIFTPEYTINEKTLAQIKTYLYGASVKAAMDNAMEMTEKLKFELNKQRPIKSISIDSTALQSYYPLYFSDTSSFYLLNQNKRVNILTLKSTMEFNIKN